ncbi:hypothetical protein ACWIGM_03205 [Bosea sp. NPDC055332]
MRYAKASEAKLQKFREENISLAPGIEIAEIDGWSMVQATGTINGSQFYFKAKHNYWLLAIGGDDPADLPEWEYEEPYGEGPYGANFMEHEIAKRLILEAAGRFLRGDPDPRIARDSSPLR